MDEYESDEEQEKQYQHFEIKEGIIFLIEITPELLTSDIGLNSHSQLYEILSSINDLMSELIITMKNTGIGIYFYNCMSNSILSSMNQPPGFYKLFKLNVLNLQNMKKLNDIIQDDTINAVENYFKHKPIEDENHLSVILNRIIDEFSSKTEFNRRKLIWITTNDKPFSETSTKENLWRIINDFYNYNFQIQPLFLDSANKIFDFDLYRDVFLNTSFLKRSQYSQVDPDQLFKDNPVKSVVSNQIREAIFRIKEIRRIQFSCNLVLSDGGTVGGNLGCSVKGYTLYSHEKYKKDLLLYTKEESIKKVFLDSKLVTENGNTIELPKHDKEKSLQDVKEEAGIRKGYEIGGGQDIVFLNKEQLEFINNYAFDHRLEEEEDPEEENLEDDEKSYVSNSQPPFLKLLGFRDLQNFNSVYSCGLAVFVTADTANGMKTTSLKGGYSNSLETLGSLYRSCIKLNQYGIVFGCIKRNSQPYLYALYPTQTINSSKLVGEDLPQGFLLIKLPWIDDVRSLPQDFITQLHDEPDKPLVDHYKSLFKNYYLDDYNPAEFPNPSLNYFYKVIKHEILQMELTLQDRKLSNNDVTIQKLIELKKKLDSHDSSQYILRQINSRLNELQERIPKRVIEDVKPEKKKVKIELDEAVVLVKWKQGKLNDFTMDQLKTFAKKYREIKTGSRKAEMVTNISNFLDSRQK